MALTKIPPYNVLNDQQWIQVSGPDSLLSGFQYDSRTRSLWQKESQIANPGFHGVTHIAEDPVPAATCDTPGLMSADDKCKMDALAQTRLGVLGFQGAGFSDDGGWMSGDIILAAGSEFISLERFGNVIRFTCFVPGSPVHLANGTTKSIEAVRTGDYVISHTGCKRRVIRTYEHLVREPIYNVNFQGHLKDKFQATGDHPVLAVKSVANRCKTHRVENCRRCIDRYNDPVWVKVKDLCVGDFVVRRYATAEVQDRSSICLSESIERIAVANGYAANTETRSSIGNAVGTFETTEHTFMPGGKTVRDKIEITPEFLRLVGYYLAEGSIGRAHGNPTSINFSIHADEVNGVVGQDISNCCFTVFGHRPKAYRDKKTGNGFKLVLHCSIAARYFKLLIPGNSHTKVVPDWIMVLPPEKQKDVLIGFFRGDGWYIHRSSSKCCGFGIAGQQLATQLAGLLERCGSTPVLSFRSVLNKRLGRYFDRWCATVQATDAAWLWTALGAPQHQTSYLDFSLRKSGFTLRRIDSIASYDYVGPVYNLEVEDEHSYVVNGVAVHNCDAPIPLNCTCEACAQIYWVQDETEVAAIRPPSCAGKLPGIDGYGELKIYLMPQSTIVDPANPTAVLNTKGLYPSLIFKRYDDSITPGEAELDLVLKRDSYNASVAEIGWAFTPGAGTAVQCYWSMGKDSDGNIIRFSLNAESAPGILGALLYNGHLLTKRMAVITDYTTQVLSTNQYTCKWWDIVNSSVADNESFTATNIWQYAYPEGGVNTKELVLDRTIGLLDIGTLVDIWFFKLGEVNGVPIRRHYFSCRPSVKAENIWSEIGGVEFGNSLTARLETTSGTFVGQVVSDIRNFEDSIWGLTGFNTPLYLLETDLGTGAAGTFSTAGGAVIVADLSQQYRARVDLVFPGLVVEGLGETHGKYTQRPVCLWNRHEISACLATIALARPLTDGVYPPYDILLSAPIDSYDEVYATVIGKGDLTHDAGFYVILDGADFADLPESGTIRVLTGIPDQTGISSLTWEYTAKTLVGLAGYNGHIALIGSTAYQGNVNDVVELLHQEYNSPCVRVKIERTSDNKVNLQCMVGTLDMTVAYDADMPDDLDDMVRGLAPGYAVSGIYTQDAPFTGIGVQPAVNVDGLVIFDGGMVTGTGGQEEFWNELEIMQRGGHVWIWWNGLLIPPSATASAILPTPVTVSTLYFPITRPGPMGKFGMRMFPGCVVRRVLVRDNNRSYDEFTRGQVGLVMG